MPRNVDQWTRAPRNVDQWTRAPRNEDQWTRAPRNEILFRRRTMSSFLPYFSLLDQWRNFDLVYVCFDFVNRTLDFCFFFFYATDERERLFECDFAIGVRHFPSMGGVYAMWFWVNIWGWKNSNLVKKYKDLHITHFFVGKNNTDAIQLTKSINWPAIHINLLVRLLGLECFDLGLECFDLGLEPVVLVPELVALAT